MKIELDEPFSHFYKLGYVVVNGENRRHVVLFNTQEDRTIISYAKYLMCVKLGYIISPEFEVDHIDDDKTNDHIDNLQVLTKQQNIAKSNNLRTILRWFNCCICGNAFSLTGKQLGQRTNKETPTCSKICGYKKVSYTLTR